jgi:hypothetical protein
MQLSVELLVQEQENPSLEHRRKSSMTGIYVQAIDVTKMSKNLGQKSGEGKKIQESPV